MDTLVEFELCLESINLTDEDIIPIFQPIPKIKFFGLSLRNNKITNNVIEILTNKISEMKNLENFQIALAETDVTIESVTPLIQNLKNMKHLYCDLIGTKINDEFVIELDIVIRSEMRNLKEFYLKIERNLDQTGQDLLDRIHHDYPFPFKN